jgi:adenine-specific DNA-methyltransferase
MILKLRKTSGQPRTVEVTSSSGSKDFGDAARLAVPYDVIVQGDEKFVFLASSPDEINVLQQVGSIGKPLASSGLKMKTGLTVDFRNTRLLRNEPGEGRVPLFFPHHVKDGKIAFPAGKGSEYISGGLPALLQPNRNYLFVRRFSAKEERRRLQCAVYLSRDFPQYRQISTQNKINFIDSADNTGLDEETVHGLYVVLNSTLYDLYYRILNGSTQDNSTEINAMPAPSRMELRLLGQRLMESGDCSTASCDNILKAVIDAGVECQGQMADDR